VKTEGMMQGGILKEALEYEYKRELQPVKISCMF